MILQSTPTDSLKRVRKIAIGFHDYASPLKHDKMEKLLTEAGFTTKLKWKVKDQPVTFTVSEIDST